jgi:hypothetical protein
LHCTKSLLYFTLLFEKAFAQRKAMSEEFFYEQLSQDLAEHGQYGNGEQLLDPLHFTGNTLAKLSFLHAIDDGGDVNRGSEINRTFENSYDDSLQSDERAVGGAQMSRRRWQNTVRLYFLFSYLTTSNQNANSC